MKHQITNAALLGALFLGVPATAGTLVVSGDSNLGNSLNGSNGASAASNGIFFSNLLGSGKKVLFQDTTNADITEVNSQAGIKSFYSGLSGVTLGSIAAPVGSADLAGMSLFIGFLPQAAFSAASTTAIQNFLSAGGTVLLTAEFVGFNPVAITNVNNLLTGLGSGMSLTAQTFDTGFQVATGTQIVANPLTAGVTSFGYAATTATVGGSTLFRTTNGTSWMAVEVTAVPEPMTSGLMLVGLLLVGAWQQRRAATAARHSWRVLASGGFFAK